MNTLSASSIVPFFRDIKLAHSVFALPFVFSSLVFIDFRWDSQKFVLILLCMICARSFAMGMNRYLDRRWDSLNPRTRQRMIPSGNLSAVEGLFWSLFFGTLFVILSFQLGTTTGFLSPLVLLILGTYPIMKTLSWFTHWYLGICLGLSPLACSVALTGTLSWEVVLLGLAVSLWTAGFDILYALQDYQFDRQNKLQSVPSRFGVSYALFLSRLCFVCMILLLFSIGLIRTSTPIYFVGIMSIAGILLWEQWIVRSSNEVAVSPRLNVAFFNANACVGIVFYIFTQLDAFWK